MRKTAFHRLYPLWLLALFIGCQNTVAVSNTTQSSANESSSVKPPSVEKANTFSEYLTKTCLENKDISHINFTEEQAKREYQTLTEPVHFKDKSIAKNTFHAYYIPPTTDIQSLFFRNGQYETYLITFSETPIPDMSAHPCQTQGNHSEVKIWNTENTQGRYLIISSRRFDNESYTLQVLHKKPDYADIKSFELLHFESLFNALAAFDNGISPATGITDETGSAGTLELGFEYPADLQVIQGEVHDEDKNPVENALAEFTIATKDKKAMTLSAKTDADGFFILKVPVGIFMNFKLSKDSYSFVEDNIVLKNHLDNYGQHNFYIGDETECREAHYCYRPLTQRPVIYESVPRMYKTNVSPGSEIKLSFSKPMVRETVLKNLQLLKVQGRDDWRNDQKMHALLSQPALQAQHAKYDISSFNYEWKENDSLLVLRWKTPPINSRPSVDSDTFTSFILSLNKDDGRIVSQDGYVQEKTYFNVLGMKTTQYVAFSENDPR